MLLKKSFSTADQNFSRPLMRFSDKYVRRPRLLVKKPTGDFDNGLGAILISEHSLASLLSKKSPAGILGLFQQHRVTPHLLSDSLEDLGWYE
jgi:hypothetical protein